MKRTYAVGGHIISEWGGGMGMMRESRCRIVCLLYIKATPAISERAWPGSLIVLLRNNESL